MESSIAVLEHIAKSIDATLSRMDTRMTRIEDRMMRLEDWQQSDFRWMMGIMIGGFSATIAAFAASCGVTAYGFHRI